MRVGIAVLAVVVVAVAFACTAAVSQEPPQPAAAAQKGVSMEIHATGEILEAVAHFPGGFVELRRSDEGLQLSLESLSPEQAFEAIHVLMETYQTVRKGTARPAEGAGQLRELRRAYAGVIERIERQAGRIERLEHALREQREMIERQRREIEHAVEELEERYLEEQRRAVEVREERHPEEHE